MRDEMDRQTPKYVSIGCAASTGSTVEATVQAACAEIDIGQTCFVLAFIPATMDVAQSVDALNRHLAGVSVFGCTSAGQITQDGYETDALMLIGFPKRYRVGRTARPFPFPPHRRVEPVGAGLCRRGVDARGYADIDP